MNNELMTQIEALDDREYLHEWGTAKAMGDGIPVTAIKSLAAELTLANKKLAILQASNDHYADEKNWDFFANNGHPIEGKFYLPALAGFDFARKAQEEIARLTEGENGNELYYIQNKGYVGNALIWWGVDSKGYTTDLRLAGKYTEEEVRSIICRPEDIAWKCSEIDSLKPALKIIFDGQYLPKADEGNSIKVEELNGWIEKR